MLAAEVLRELNFGNSVAEFDNALERYFVETHTFRTLVQGEADIIAGDKGTGKTALFLILKDRYTTLPELDATEIVPAFNPTGNPIFQRLLEDGVVLTEAQYIVIWKTYIFSLVANWALSLVIDELDDEQKRLHSMLQRLDLLSTDDTPLTIFSRVVNMFRRLGRISSIGAGVTVLPTGIPLVTPRVDFAEPAAPPAATEVPFEEAFGLLNSVLGGIEVTTWVVFDRLDEAFQGAPATEVPALRALFRTYLDLVPFERLRLKLFVRRDLFRRIIGAGFVNLTHINARKIEITWEDDDLWDLLRRRVAESPTFVTKAELSADNMEAIWEALFPEQVDQGARKPKTGTWIIRRIRDGNDVRPPRNLIDLLKKAQQVQLKRDEREPREYPSGPLLTSESLKRGLAMLSDERVQDTLLAEAGEAAPHIERFRGGKAEHNLDTLAALLQLGPSELAAVVKVLTEMGFLEKIGSSYKVPTLYREGLSITQGKAFSGVDVIDSDDDE